MLKKTTLDIIIDPDVPIPIYVQIIIQIKSFIAGKVLVPGDKLPSVRKLSRQLGINPNTVARAYQGWNVKALCALRVELERLSEKTQKGIVTTAIRTYKQDSGLPFIEAYHLQYTRGIAFIADKTS